MKSLYAACVIGFAASAANAQESGDVSVALGFSTLGANLEAAYRIDPSFRVRGALIGGVDVSYEESDEDADFEGDAELGGFALLGDYYPTHGGWRLSGGVFFSNSELNATGTADIDGLGVEAVTTTAAFKNDISAMITTGYDVTMGGGWSFNSEIGLILTGGIDVDFIADNPLVQDQVDADADLQETKDDFEDITIYPYIGLSVSYSF